MAHIGRLEGKGQVQIKGQTIGKGSYQIDVSERVRGGVKDGAGFLDAEYGIIHRIMEARGADLILEDGSGVRIVVSRWSFGSPARIMTDGRIPGF